MEATRHQEQFKEQKSKLSGSAVVYKSKSLKLPQGDTDKFWSELQEKVKAVAKPSIDKSLEIVRKHPVACVMGVLAFGVTFGFLASTVRYQLQKSKNE